MHHSNSAIEQKDDSALPTNVCFSYSARPLLNIMRRIKHTKRRPSSRQFLDPYIFVVPFSTCRLHQKHLYGQRGTGQSAPAYRRISCKTKWFASECFQTVCIHSRMKFDAAAANCDSHTPQASRIGVLWSRKWNWMDPCMGWLYAWLSATSHTTDLTIYIYIVYARSNNAKPYQNNKHTYPWCTFVLKPLPVNLLIAVVQHE